MPVAPPQQRLLSPEEIAVQAGQQVPYVRLPEVASVFADRELRLREKAAGHAMREFLLFMAELARCQHEALATWPAVPLPDPAALDAAARAGQPPLPAGQWPRDPAWRQGLRGLLDRLLPRLAGSPAEAGVRAVRQASDSMLEQQADRLLTGTMRGLDLAAAPLVAAALQVHWVHLVTATQAARGDSRTPPFGRTDDPSRCPCCGSLPTASISRIGAEASGYRYLHCSLCSAEWHMVRIKCTHCQSTKGIQYHSLQPAGQADAVVSAASSSSSANQPAVQAETCDECGHYLKIVHMERDAHVEPAADDLASVTLDLLVAEAGYERHGVNLMLLFGEAEPEPGNHPSGGGG